MKKHFIVAIAIGAFFYLASIALIYLIIDSYYSRELAHQHASLEKVMAEKALLAKAPQRTIAEANPAREDTKDIQEVSFEATNKDTLESFLQQQAQSIDSTHITRKYHQRYALFNAASVFYDNVTQNTLEYYKTKHDEAELYIDAPELGWQRTDQATPIDIMRLTFRGNGIPKDVEKLAKSMILSPKQRAFYEIITQKNAILWKSGKTIAFNVRTAKDKIYKAQSAPFISIQKTSRDHIMKMQAAALPFLWNVYFSKNPGQEMAREDGARLLAQTENSEDVTQSFINDLPPVSAFRPNEKVVQELFHERMIRNAPDPGFLKNNIPPQGGIKEEEKEDSHFELLARIDPELSALFLVNNLFEQYNIFSSFTEGVSLTINAIDTRLNVLYVSYTTHFTPLEDTTGIAEEQARCNGRRIGISDEFFLVTAQQHSYLIRVYIPDCGYLTKSDYAIVDELLNNIRILW